MMDESIYGVEPEDILMSKMSFCNLLSNSVVNFFVMLCCQANDFFTQCTSELGDNYNLIIGRYVLLKDITSRFFKINNFLGNLIVYPVMEG